MESKTIVISGARGCVAKAIAKRFKSKGYFVIGISRTGGQLQNYDLIIETNYDTITLPQHINKFHVLVNTIGTNSQSIDECIKVNVDLPNKVVNSIIEKLRLDGVVINISSVSGLRTGNNKAYSESKSMLENLTRSMAKKFAPTRVMSIAPAFIQDTNWFNFNDEYRKKIVNETPLHRICTTQDVADAVECCTDFLKFSTGSTLVLDGGRLL